MSAKKPGIGPVALEIASRILNKIVRDLRSGSRRSVFSARVAWSVPVSPIIICRTPYGTREVCHKTKLFAKYIIFKLSLELLIRDSYS